MTCPHCDDTKTVAVFSTETTGTNAQFLYWETCEECDAPTEEDE